MLCQERHLVIEHLSSMCEALGWSSSTAAARILLYPSQLSVQLAHRLPSSCHSCSFNDAGRR